MALQSVTKTLNARRANNTNLFTIPLTSTKPTGGECDADLVAQAQALAATAQGSADELNELASKV